MFISNFNFLLNFKYCFVRAEDDASAFKSEWKRQIILCVNQYPQFKVEDHKRKYFQIFNLAKT